jgi:magnesium transporter
MSSLLLPVRELAFETASEHHTARVPIAAPKDRVAAVWESLRGRRFDSAGEIVVCDPAGRLLGLVNIEDLFAADGETPLERIMDPSPPAVAPGIDQEIAAWQAIRHRETSLAVVSEGRVFQGIITPTRIFEVLLSEHDEDTARLGGFLRSSSEAYTASDEPMWRRLGHRMPWLALGLLGAMLSADLVGFFEGQLHANIVLAFFVPGIVYLADAVGTQTETLVIRGLSVGIPIERGFWRESVTGFVVGLALAGLCFPIVLWRWGRTDVALSVSLALLMACSIASTLALVLPWTLRWLRQDPAFAAGPVATVVQDLLSVLIYFLVCLAVVQLLHAGPSRRTEPSDSDVKTQ